MKRIERLFLLLVLIVISSSAFAGNNGEDFEEKFDWQPVMDAIINVESGGNAKARSGLSCGVMQITPMLVRECNEILRRRKSKKRFKLSDRFSISKSKEMFLLIQSFHNPMNNVEQAIRSWNGGINYSVKRTQKYFNKVMKYLNQN